MNTLTLKIPEELETALERASARRRMTKSAVVRQALEHALADELRQSTPAANWVTQWSGVLACKASEATATGHGDARVAHILQKHLR